eukprot:11183998-Lingulodinium_polyedra.AAC.1
MISEIHPIAAEPHISERARAVRRPPYGGRRIAKRAAPQQWHAFLSALLNGSRARTAHARVQKFLPLLQRRAFCDSRAPRADHRAAVDAWTACCLGAAWMLTCFCLGDAWVLIWVLLRCCVGTAW